MGEEQGSLWGGMKWPGGGSGQRGRIFEDEAEECRGQRWVVGLFGTRVTEVVAVATPRLGSTFGVR